MSRTATAAPKPPQALLTVTPAAGSGIVAGVAPVKQKYQLAQTSEGITRQKIEQTINVVDTASLIHSLRGHYEVELFPQGGAHWANGVRA